MTGLDEHDLIARFFRPLAKEPAAFGLIDDAAVLTPPAGRDLVITKDGIAEGFHFLPGETGQNLARKALRVNLSDLVAKGADPLGYFLLLGLPEDWTEAWLTDFTAALQAEQETHRIALYGGDTIRSAGLTVAITAIGTVPIGRAVRRSGAVPGDIVFVSGTIGDGALGLLAARREGHAISSLSASSRRFLENRYRVPQPPIALAPAIRDHASAAIDISDGLVGDLDKLCRASGVSARIDCARVPLSEAARTAVTADEALFELCLTGGDDYEVLCAVRPGQAQAFAAAAGEAGIRATAIGEIVEGSEAAAFIRPDGSRRAFARRSFSHTG